MDRKTFDDLNIQDQVTYINNGLKSGKSVSQLANELNLPRKTLTGRLSREGYLLKQENDIKQYIKDESSTINVEYQSNNELTESEVNELRELLKIKEALFELINDSSNNNNNEAIPNKLINLNKKNRTKRTFNMDNNILKQLSDYSEDTGINQSDIVNFAVMEYLRNK